MYVFSTIWQVNDRSYVSLRDEVLGDYVLNIKCDVCNMYIYIIYDE